MVLSSEQELRSIASKLGLGGSWNLVVFGRVHLVLDVIDNCGSSLESNLDST
jgi:hypothetical protein